MKPAFRYLLCCTALFAFPLLIANNYYIDDIGRSTLGYTNWGADGRPLADIVMKLLFLSSHMTDIFPLPLLLSIFMLAFSLHQVTKKALTGWQLPGLVLIPLTFFANPYLAEVFSYRFDVLTLTAAISLSLLYFCLPSHNRWLRFVTGTMMLIAIYCLYQTAINIAVLLVMAGLYQQMARQDTAKAILTTLLHRVVEVLLATVIYLKLILTVTFSGKNEANHPALAVGNLWKTWTENSEAYSQFIADTLVKNHGGMHYLLGITIAMWLSALALSLLFLRRQRDVMAAAVAVIALITPFIALLMIPGSLLLLQNPLLSARSLIAVSGFMLLAALVINYALTPRLQQANWLLLIPVVYGMTAYYAYGNALRQQDKFNQSLVQEIKWDMRELPSESFYLFFNGQAPRSPVYTNSLKNYPMLSVMVPDYFANWYWPFPYMKNNGFSALWPAPDSGVTTDTAQYLCHGKPVAQNQDYMMYRKDKVILIDFTHASCGS
ncbi:uncharacterized membrane protein HdeD (DUF308 family) [Erwinia persicina]|uniref:Glucosyltransferase domain-containing protein n=1 Tax=Erwinia aeris TaxID=3239803 RepID=A0ABV4E6X8_9GAMM|nr:MULTISPECIES: glucosyltransferase domain-containing protein [Erwinia]MCP1438850.1 uncharacterized membrane protein HdeD (DUF308 family) [Erwinia persicina]MDN4626860.1 glucosyltransferase domain-containing protein [Erwinia sp. PsM31]